MMAVNFLIDHTPIWVWLTMLIMAIGALSYFFSPILVPLWAITPKWLKVVLAFIASIALAALAGRYKGRKDAELERQQHDKDAIQNRTEVDDEVSKLSPADRDKRLDRWMRD